VKTRALKSKASFKVGSRAGQKKQKNRRQKTKGKATPDLDPVVLDFISSKPMATKTLVDRAARDYTGSTFQQENESASLAFCRRDVPRQHYLSDSVIAPASESTDCARCSPKPSLFCCDLCLSRALAADATLAAPQLIQDALTLGIGPRPPPAPRRARPLKTMRNDATALKEHALRASLVEWRSTAAASRFAALDLAPEDVIPDELLDRLVSLAHRTDKLLTIDDIAFHLCWDSCREFGGDIISLLRAAFPLPPSGKRAASPIEVDTLGEVENVLGVDGGAGRKRKMGKCSACGRRDGHRSNHIRRCRAQNPMHPKYDSDFKLPKITPPNSPSSSDDDKENSTPRVPRKRPGPTSPLRNPLLKRHKPNSHHTPGPVHSRPFGTSVPPPVFASTSTPVSSSSSRPLALTPTSMNRVPPGPRPSPYPVSSMPQLPLAPYPYVLATPSRPSWVGAQLSSQLETPPPTISVRRLFQPKNSNPLNPPFILQPSTSHSPSDTVMNV